MGAALFFMSGGSISVSAPAAERHHAAARTKVPPRPTSGPAPQPTSRARRSFPSRTLHPIAGGTRGIREATPQKTAGRGQTASGHGPLPRHSIQSGQKTGGSGKGRKQRRRRDGGEGGTEGKEGMEVGKEKRGKEARKLESRKAGKQEAGKRGSREAGKPGSGEAGGGIKKRRRTVGCTSACGSPQSLAYRNYLLR